MKKLINIFCIVSLIALMTSCAKTYQAKLHATADQINKELPMDLGNGISMDSLSYDTDYNTIVFHYSISEEIQTIKNLRNAREAQRRFLQNYLSSQQGNEFTKLLTDADANIRLEYTGRKSGDKVSLDFYSNEIKELQNKQEGEVDDRTRLADIIAISNAQCPMQMDGDNLVMTGVALGDASIEFSYTYNPEVYDFANADIEDLKATLEPELQAELKAPGNQAQLELMKKLGVGVSYSFEAEGYEPIVFGFTPEEISKL